MSTTTTYELMLEPAKLGPDGEELAPARMVKLRELTVPQFESCMKLAGDDGDWELAQFGLRMSIIEDGGEALDYQALNGSRLNDRYSTRQLLMLREAWANIHVPQPEDHARVRAMTVVTDS